jgi:tetratricopeptide (TPR) repeat protein
VLDYHQRAGANAEERGDFQNAIYHYGKIVTFVPWSSPARQRLGGVLFKTGEYGKALVQYNEALRYDRNAIPPRLGIARVLIAQQRFLEARGLIEVIRRLEPANVEAHALLRSLPPA